MRGKNNSWDNSFNSVYSEMKITNTALNLKGQNQCGLKQVEVREVSFAFKFIFTYFWTFYLLSLMTIPLCLQWVEWMHPLVHFQVKLIENLSLRSSDNGSVNWCLWVESSDSLRCQTFKSKGKERGKGSKALKTTELSSGENNLLEET